MKKLALLVIAGTMFSCSKEKMEPVKVENIDHLISNIKNSTSASELKEPLIKEIINVLDFGNRDQRKTVMNAVYNIHGNFREKKVSLKQDIRTSNNINENSSEAEILIQLNDIHSFDSSSGWDANGDLLFMDEQLDFSKRYRYTWTVAEGLLYTHRVSSFEIITTKESEYPAPYDPSNPYMIAAPSTHAGSFLIGFTPGLSWQETSNDHFDGIFHFYFETKGLMSALGFNIAHGSARYANVFKAMQSSGKSIDLY